MADKWSDTGTFNPMIDCAYIRNGGDNGVAENFKVTITSTPSTGIKTSTSITNTVTTSTSISNVVNASTSITNTVDTSLTGKGTANNDPIYISVSSQGLGKDAKNPIYTDLSYVGTKTEKPIYTDLSNIGTKNDVPIYIRASMPITEFTANIALQIYSWSNSMTTDGKQSIGNARRAAQDAFVRAEEFVKQLVREKYIVDIDKTNGLVVWRTDINKIM